MRRLGAPAAALVVAGAAAAIAAAASLSAPGAVTGPVTSVSATSVTVSGTVTPNGESTTWYVEYGKTTSYGSKTGSHSAGSGTTGVAVSTALSGLAAGTTYHYRLVATNASGTAHGADAIVTTVGAAPEATTQPADRIGPFRARLNGTVDPNGLSTTWYFEYGTSTSYGAKTPLESGGSGSSPTSVAVDVVGLQAGVTYHFRLVATNDSGTARGSDRSFTTDAPPSARTGSASSVTGTTAVVSGLVDPHGRSTKAWFEYGTSTGYGQRTPAQDAGFGRSDRTITATLSGLRPSTTYHFRIVAQSDAGTVRGADASFRTLSSPTVTTGSASNVGAGSANVSGSVNPNGRTTRWYVEYGTTSGYGSRTSSQSAGNGTSTLQVATTLGGLRPATAYHFRIVASSSGGTSRGADATFQTLAPPSVRTGVVTRLSTTTAIVAGTVDPLGQSTTYWIEFGRTAGYGLRTPTGSLQPGSGAVAVSFPLSGLQPGRRYHFRVVASNPAGTTVGRDASFSTVPLPRDPRTRRVVRCTIVGTVGPDRLRGTPGPDVICGLGGGDVIHGLGGNDVVFAGPGDDVVDGGRGNDVLYGNTGNDTLTGSIGADRLDGGPGRDLLFGGPGRDVLLARDGARDVVNGGPGRDAGTRDRGDRVVSVERRLR